MSLQSVGAGPRGRAFLAVGRPGDADRRRDRHLVNAAVMLLTIRLEQIVGAPTPGSACCGRPLLRLVLAGQVNWPVRSPSTVAALAREPVTVLVATGDIAGVARRTR